MKAIFITLLALVAAPALAEFDEIANRGVQYSGSLASRATTEIQADGAQAAPDAAPAPDAQTFCRLPTSAVSGAPPGAANIDGTCIAVNACFNQFNGRAFTGVCPSGACCIKNDCAGPNSNSACLLPNLAGDTLRQGQSGRFVNGACPTGLRCFQLTRT